MREGKGKCNVGEGMGEELFGAEAASVDNSGGKKWFQNEDERD